MKYNDIKELILTKKHYQYRKEVNVNLANLYSENNLSYIERMTRRFEYLSSQETPIVFPGEKIAFLRTIKNIPDVLTEKEWEDLKSKKYIHERGYHSNFTPNYEKILNNGLDYLKNLGDNYSSRCVVALQNLISRYEDEERKNGNDELANILRIIKHNKATSFHEALQLFRIIHYALWLEGNYHITVGRFDRYMYPFYKHDIDNNVLTKDDAYLLLEEFFLSFNKDNDLYPGIQQGDNGQSMVLGGYDENGNDVFNELSELCLKASGAIMCIDPKINIRVNKKTPLDTYIKGTELTKKGLGFPQYTNDDIAIPALLNYGYDKNDAINYAMAACWELIIPNVGTDIANIGALSFNKVINNCVDKYLNASNTIDEFLNHVNLEIKSECLEIVDKVNDVYFIPSPLFNVAMDVKNGIGKYNNFGIHGTGIANASDALAAIEKYVFIEKTISKSQLIEDLHNNFINHPTTLHMLRYDAPKVGQDNDFADKYLVHLLHQFYLSTCTLKNKMGGVVRAGTGSAMYYLWHADEIGASPDGRRKGEPLATNFSVSLFADIEGPFSLINSMTKPNFVEAMNGGPLTLEFDSKMWDTDDAIENFAKFIKTYFELGGHQIQLNSISLEKLKDAQLHPENYDRLIVRIWGWSAYFTALDKRYQDHVISRQEYKI